MRWLREHPWLSGLAGSALLLAAWEGGVWRATGLPPWTTAAGEFGIILFLLTWACLLAACVVRVVLRLEWAPLAVARTVLDEALRMKLAVIFIALLLLWVAGLPLFLDPGSPLRYRIQTFLHYTLGMTAFLLSLLTVFLACGTLAFEIQDKRIHAVACKPIRRGEYLLGKWLGVMLLNAVFLGVVGAALLALTALLAAQPAMDEYDARAVRDEVLTARFARAPEPEIPFERTAEERLAVIRREAPEQIQADGEDVVRARLLGQARLQWWSIAPQRSETYVFSGLDSARRGGQTVQLRFTLRSASRFSMNESRLGFEINGRRFAITAVTGIAKVIPVPAELIDERGRLKLTVHNVDPLNPSATPDASAVFEPNTGLEVLCPAGGFGANLLRALLIEWVKLGFLAALGLAAATFLGFPVACLAALAVLFAAYISGFVLGGLGEFGLGSSGAAQQASAVIRTILKGVTWLLQHYSQYAPAEDVADGRLAPWSDVVGCVLSIGVLWTGAVALAGWLVFRGRELAREQV